jgi:hypothetical protein
MMNLKTLLTAAALLLAVPPTVAQTRRPTATVSGHVTDKSTGETLIEAGVLSGEAGAATNSYGFYTLTLPKGEGVTLRYSYVGYRDTTVTLDLVRDTTVNVVLEADSRLSEAVVSARRETGITATRMSSIEIPMNLIRNTPTLFGESDVLKTIQLMPGVQGGAEGFSGIYVRGGGPDENLLLLDGISLYNAEHMLGLFSIFQPEAVKKVTLHKGAFPARYGGRISSIIDVRTNDGNLQETHGTVGVGLLSDKFHLEGPVIKGKTTYSVSARGMHTILFDGLLRAFKVPANYFFYDLDAKVSHRFSDSDRLFLNVYHGRDVFYYKDKEEDDSSYGFSSVSDDKTRIDWGNTVAALRWNHVFSGRLFANTTLAWTGYDMDMGYSTRTEDAIDGNVTKYTYKFDYASGIRDITAKIDFDYTPSSRHLVKFGGEYVHHTFVPETCSSVEKEENGGKNVTDTTYTNGNNPDRKGHEFSLYAEDDFSVWKWLTLNPGLHLSMFVTSGRTYWSPEPRISAKVDFGKGVSAKAAYSRMSQYVHLLSSARITLPVDLWVPITKDIKPVTADQYSLGLYYSGLQGWEFSVEGYWKEMHNVLEYKDGITFLASSQSWEDNVVMGEGRAFGVELFIQKTAGKTTGWLGYTLAKSDRIFANGLINNGERYPYRYDRRHNISLVVNQKLGRKWDISAVWTFATGGATTVPEREVVLQQPDGTFVQVDYSPHRNNYRLPPSHRLNIGVNYHKKKRRGESVWNFGVYNAYNRLNPNFVFYRSNSVDETDSNLYERREKLKSITILPVLPSFGYTYNF